MKCITCNKKITYNITNSHHDVLYKCDICPNLGVVIFGNCKRGHNIKICHACYDLLYMEKSVRNLLR